MQGEESYCKNIMHDFCSGHSIKTSSYNTEWGNRFRRVIPYFLALWERKKERKGGKKKEQ